MPKRLVFCFDGTWNRLSTDNPTNVVKIAQMVEPIARNGVSQVVYYDEGIGTDKNWLGRVHDGIFGKGMVRILREAYRFLIFNYSPGDEIFAFGFSRGAYTARSFIGFIRHAGILDVASAPQIDKALDIYRLAPAGITGEESGVGLRFRSQYCRGVCVSEIDREFRQRVDPAFDAARVPLLDVRFVGVWDTVRALGVPEFLPGSRWFNRKYGFHDAVLTSKIKAARHAVALDERRPTFLPTLLGRKKIAELNGKSASALGKPFQAWNEPYHEQWFPGVHGAVGGGGKRRGLSDVAMQWVLIGARRAGLEVRDETGAVAFDLEPDPFDDIHNEDPGLMKKLQAAFYSLLRISRKGPSHSDEISLATYRRWTAGASGTIAAYAPRSLCQVGKFLRNWPYRNPPEVKADAVVPFEDYLVGHGDSLSRLAGDRLGDAMRWDELFELNRDRIDDPDFLPIGISLRMPRKIEGENAVGP